MQVTLTQEQLQTISNFLNSQPGLPASVEEIAAFLKSPNISDTKEESEESLVSKVKKVVKGK